MSELAGIGAISVGYVRQTPEPDRPAIAAVEPTAADPSLNGRMESNNSGGRQNPSDDQGGRSPHVTQRARPDPNVTPGPPPAFQASLLELEQDLRNVIARVEAARGQREAAMAFSQPPPAQPNPTAESPHPASKDAHESELAPADETRANADAAESAATKPGPEPESDNKNDAQASET